MWNNHEFCFYIVPHFGRAGNSIRKNLLRGCVHFLKGGFFMKMPNGYGSVYKLSGNRRKPWAARVTDGWVNNPKINKSKQVYKFVGFYEITSRVTDSVLVARYNEFINGWRSIEHR